MGLTSKARGLTRRLRLPTAGIRTKITLGFAAVLVVLVGVSGASLWSADRTGAEVDHFAEMVAAEQRASDIRQKFTAMRLEAQAFAVDGTASAANAVKGYAEELEPLLAQAVEDAHDDRLRSTAEMGSKAFDEYMSAFTSFVDVRLAWAEEVESTLLPNARTLLESISIMIDDALINGQEEVASYLRPAREHALSLRYNLARFLGEKDSQTAEEVTRNISDIVTPLRLVAYALPNAKENETYQTLMDAQKAVEESFASVQESTERLQAIQTFTLSSRARALDASVDAIQAGVREEALRIKDKTVAMTDLATTVTPIIGGAGLLIGLVLAVLIGTGLSRPIQAMTGAMTRLADGDLSVDVPARGRGDEIGRMADAVEVFKEHAEANQRMEAERAEMARKAEEERRSLMQGLADDFENTVGGIVASVSAASTQMKQTAEGMASAADDASRQANFVANASEEASSNVQTVAAASEELHASIAEIGRQVSQSSNIAHDAVREAQRTDEMVRGLAEAATKIGTVVAMITDIAEQTNLLALNATIEAARAGDAGKGFAVVAHEVKALANQTSNATGQISAQITEIQNATQDTVDAIGSISRIIGEIDSIGSTIAAAVEEQTAATQEIARNVQQAAQGTQEVSTHIAGVTKAAGETGTASTHVLDASQDLSNQADRLTHEMQQFLMQVRAS
ncbi:methyl-accepting chemotaxis sensory transducer [Caenispirillum salinarum AK4]|uniref:Methyl-accepting chemotaxis sensory transducer n=1 Tax=Caenispirillum salinarum AK4 TaxID=1238182 RepID=K9GWQ5_9PROT|nr:HAMP domain-containing methyl-accepting chemotaxis protein [Caenispirillum salinarum]EKV29174.1 methyl-accepting chemotaxis sensory transducer [Caenispirillum salinarum AK4]